MNELLRHTKKAATQTTENLGNYLQGGNIPFVQESASPNPLATGETPYTSESDSPPNGDIFSHRMTLVARHRQTRFDRRIKSKLTWYSSRETSDDDTAQFTRELTKTERRNLTPTAERIYHARKAGDIDTLRQIEGELGGIAFGLLNSVVDAEYPEVSKFERRAQTNTLTTEDNSIIVSEATKSLKRFENLNPRRLATNLQLAGFSKEESARLAIKLVASQGAAWAWRGVSTAMPLWVAANAADSTALDDYSTIAKVLAAFALHAGVLYVSHKTVDADMRLLDETGFCPEPGKMLAREFSERLEPDNREFQTNNVRAMHWGASIPPRAWEEGAYGLLNIASPEAAIAAHAFTGAVIGARNVAEHLIADGIALHKNKQAVHNNQLHWSTRRAMQMYDWTTQVMRKVKPRKDQQPNEMFLDEETAGETNIASDYHIE